MKHDEIKMPTSHFIGAGIIFFLVGILAALCFGIAA